MLLLTGLHTKYATTQRLCATCRQLKVLTFFEAFLSHQQEDGLSRSRRLIMASRTLSSSHEIDTCPVCTNTYGDVHYGSHGTALHCSVPKTSAMTKGCCRKCALDVQYCFDTASFIYYIRLRPITNGHRQLNIGHPVRSAIHKQLTG